MPFTIQSRISFNALYQLTPTFIARWARLHPNSVLTIWFIQKMWKNSTAIIITMMALIQAQFWHQPDCPFIRIWVVYSVFVPFDMLCSQSHLSTINTRSKTMCMKSFLVYQQPLDFPSCSLFSVGHTHTHSQLKHMLPLQSKSISFRKSEEALIVADYIFAEVHISLRN